MSTLIHEAFMRNVSLQFYIKILPSSLRRLSIIQTESSIKFPLEVAGLFRAIPHDITGSNLNLTQSHLAPRIRSPSLLGPS